MLERNFVPLLFWSGVGIIGYSTFGLIGVGITLIVLAIVCLL